MDRFSCLSRNVSWFIIIWINSKSVDLWFGRNISRLYRYFYYRSCLMVFKQAYIANRWKDLLDDDMDGLLSWHQFNEWKNRREQTTTPIFSSTLIFSLFWQDRFCHSNEESFLKMIALQLLKPIFDIDNKLCFTNCAFYSSEWWKEQFLFSFSTQFENFCMQLKFFLNNIKFIL